MLKIGCFCKAQNFAPLTIQGQGPKKKLSLSESDPTLDQKNTRNKNTLFPKIPVVNNGGNVSISGTIVHIFKILSILTYYMTSSS